jgi:AbrB family looped-hinge helix DNA binding protein
MNPSPPNQTTVKVSSRHQIVIPSLARKNLHIQAGDRLLIDIQDGILVLVPEPESYTDALSGLHQELWAQTDSDDYLERERDAWTSSESA